MPFAGFNSEEIGAPSIALMPNVSRLHLSNYSGSLSWLPDAKGVTGLTYEGSPGRLDTLPIYRSKQLQTLTFVGHDQKYLDVEEFQSRMPQTRVSFVKKPDR
jgi:hypothetical protein